MYLNKKPMDIKWVTGFLEGEGTFNIAISNDRRVGFSMQPQFKVNLVDRDRKALEEIKDFLFDQGIIGHIRTCSKETLQGNASDQCSYAIQNLDGCFNLSKILAEEGLHLPSKRKELEIWTEILKRIEKKMHLNKDGFIGIMVLVDELHSIRKERSKRKYTTEYFEKLWEMTE